MKRNKIEEIRDLKNRKEFDTFWETTKRLQVLNKSMKELFKIKSEQQSDVFRYIPVALIAIMESFFRSSSKRIIESDEKYLNNTKALFEINNIKIDFEVLRTMHKKEVTIGELISHHLSFGKFEQIDFTFSNLLGIKFSNELKKYITRNPSQLRKSQSNLFVKHNEEIVKNIVKLFEYRNIICHEMASDIIMSQKEIEKLFSSASIYITQI